jgi:hypothetical protein
MPFPRSRKSELQRFKIKGYVFEMRGESISENEPKIPSTNWVEYYNDNGDPTRIERNSSSTMFREEYFFNDEGITIGKKLYANDALFENETWEYNENSDLMVIRTTNNEGHNIRIVKYEYNDDGNEVGGSYENKSREFIFRWTYEWQEGLPIRSTWNTNTRFDYGYNSAQWLVKTSKYDDDKLSSEIQIEYMATDAHGNWTEQKETKIENGIKKLILRKRSLFYREDSLLP